MSLYIYIHIYMIIIQYQDNDVGLPIFLIIYYDKDWLHDWIFPSKASSDRNFVDQSIESLEIWLKMMIDEMWSSMVFYGFLEIGRIANNASKLLLPLLDFVEGQLRSAQVLPWCHVLMGETTGKTVAQPLEHLSDKWVIMKYLKLAG